MSLSSYHPAALDDLPFFNMQIGQKLDSQHSLLLLLLLL